jgi:hypothetical protein
MANPSILKRNVPGNTVQDPGAIAVNEYSNAVGAMKVSENGRHLLPLPTPGTGTGYTTNVSGAPYALPSAGRNLAVFNSTATTGSITFGQDDTVTALAAGTTDSSGRVGLPCPQGWSYFAGGYSNWVISSASTLYVFLINDQSSIQAVAPALLSQTSYPQL